ncbi:MAG: hypothetical protein AAF393_11385 [Pseudomonadota bacterium]
MIRSVVLAAALIGSAANASQSCFARAYSDSHMARNPNQTVEVMWIAFQGDANNARHVGDWADTTVQLKGEGGAFFERLFCDGANGSKVTCRVECDGGSFTVAWRNSDTILVTTGRQGFYVTSQCEGAVNRVVKDRGAASTTYRLNRVSVEACPKRQ